MIIYSTIIASYRGWRVIIPALRAGQIFWKGYIMDLGTLNNKTTLLFVYPLTIRAFPTLRS